MGSCVVNWTCIHRDGVASGDPAVEERKNHFEDIFKLLETAGERREKERGRRGRGREVGKNEGEVCG